MMLSDEPIDSDSAKVVIDQLREVIAAYRQDDEELSNARRCLGVLMSTQIEHWQGGAKSTIGRLVQLAREENGAEARKTLSSHGLRLRLPRVDKGETALELWVANQHRALDKVFAGTDWASGGWTRALKELEGSSAGADSAWFDAYRSRYVRVPEEYLPPREKSDNDASSN
jgi:hypothetical protein